MLRSFLERSFREQLLLVQTTLLVVVIGVGIRLVHYDRLRGGLNAVPTVPIDSSLPREQLGWSVDTVATVLPGEWNCLVRALIAEQLLVRRGYEAKLRFGIDESSVDSNGSGELQAHAWIESDDVVVVGGSNLSEYTVLQPSGP